MDDSWNGRNDNSFNCGQIDGKKLNSLSTSRRIGATARGVGGGGRGEGYIEVK